MFRTLYARRLYREIFLQNKSLPEHETRAIPFLPPALKQNSRKVMAKLNVRAACAEKATEQVLKAMRLPLRQYRYAPFVAVDCEQKDAERVCQHLRRNPYVSHAALARLLYIPELQPRMGFPVSKKQTRLSGQRWNLENIGAGIANETTKGEGVRVGIIDTGADYKHEAIRGRFDSEKGYNFVDDTDDPYDGNGHGTHVAGIVAGDGIGVAPACTLYAIKVLTDEGYGSEADVLSGIEWAIDQKLDVINMSLGSSFYSAFEDAVVQEAYKRGVIVVAAAGNESYGPSYPASLENVIAVAAVDRSNEHAEFSNIYATNDISAPGVDIYSSVPGGYQQYSGTSMATPHVTGCLALARSLSDETPASLEKNMKSTAEPLGLKGDSQNQEKYGAGLVRADQLVAALQLLSPLQEVRLA